MDHRDFTITTRSGEQLASSIYGPRQAGPWPVAVLFHGFGSKRMNATNTALIPRLLEHGIAVVVTDLAGHGESTGDLSTQNSVRASREVHDVVTYILGEPMIDPSRVAVLGNSFSGGASILAAGQLPIRGLALKAPLCDYEHVRRLELGEEKMRRWEEQGTIVSPSGITAAFSNILESRTVDVYASFDSLTMPVQVWQGTEDEVIPASDWQRLETLCHGATRTFTRVEGADHVLSDPHFGGFITDATEFLTKVVS